MINDERQANKSIIEEGLQWIERVSKLINKPYFKYYNNTTLLMCKDIKGKDIAISQVHSIICWCCYRDIYK